MALTSIDDVMTHTEREAIVKGYAQLAGFARGAGEQEWARRRRPTEGSWRRRSAGITQPPLIPSAHFAWRRQEIDIVQRGQPGDLGRVGHPCRSS